MCRCERCNGRGMREEKREKRKDEEEGARREEEARGGGRGSGSGSGFLLVCLVLESGNHPEPQSAQRS